MAVPLMRRKTDSSPQTVTAHTSGPRVCTTLPTLDAQYVTTNPRETWWGLWGGCLGGRGECTVLAAALYKVDAWPADCAAPRVDGVGHLSGEAKELLGDTMTDPCIQWEPVDGDRKSKNVQVLSLCSDGCLGFLDVSCFVCVPPTLSYPRGAKERVDHSVQPPLSKMPETTLIQIPSMLECLCRLYPLSIPVRKATI